MRNMSVRHSLILLLYIHTGRAISSVALHRPPTSLSSSHSYRRLSGSVGAALVHNWVSFSVLSLRVEQGTRMAIAL